MLSYVVSRYNRNMIHPSELLRTDSNSASHFSAPVDASRRTDIDCGIAVLPCISERLNLERWAKAGIFLTTFCILGFFLGATLSYFRGTVHVWMLHYTISPYLTDWLLYMNEIFVGVFAFVITYPGDRIHRPSWLGALAIFQALASCVLIIPEFYEHLDNPALNNSVVLCGSSSVISPSSRESNYVAIVVLFLYQMFFAFVTIAFYTLGLTYLDDNINKENAIVYLCLPMAAKMCGRQIGMYLSWIPILVDSLKIFFTPMWLLLSVLTFISGVVITMFPRRLPFVLMKHTVASLINIANGNEPIEEERIVKDGFLTTLLRLLKNPLLMVNISVALFMSTALVNFELFQNYFFKSRFKVSVGRDLSGYQDPMIAQIITNLMKQPFIVISIVATGLLIAKTKPRPKTLAIWNVCICVIAALLFASHAFLSCDVHIQSEKAGMISTSFCRSTCRCNSDIPFAPVCTEEGQSTFFSACHAGCRSVEETNRIKIFRNCSCGEHLHRITNTSATEGSCNGEFCNLLFALSQTNGVLSSAVLAAGTIISLFINLRCVLASDKAMALAVETTLLGIIPYVPGKVVYSTVAEALCKYRGRNSCLLHSEAFGTFFSVTTVVLMIISALLAIIVVFLIKDLNLYEEIEPKSSDDGSDVFEEIHDDNPPVTGRSANNTRRSVPEEETLMNRNMNADGNLDFRLRSLEENTDVVSTPPNTPEEGNSRLRQRKTSDDLLESAF